MTAFNKELFANSGDYTYYNGKFVARFKWDKRDRKPFLKFLAANFTVEEYFAEYEAGTPPLKILNAKGYVSNNMKRALARLANA